MMTKNGGELNQRDKGVEMVRNGGGWSCSRRVIGSGSGDKILTITDITLIQLKLYFGPKLFKKFNPVS